MPRATGHPWRFKARFRRHAFGWRSQPAITRLVEAVAEIKQIARVDPVAYRRDRRKDQLLQENGDCVLRFLAEDAGKELDLLLAAVLRALTHRTQSASLASPLRVLRRPPS
jgi:very-short-patch-repair endonuclease